MISEVDLPKKPSDIGTIRRIFLDPTASHLIISTTLGENYYLHTQSRSPRPLSKLRGIRLETISWNPSQPTASTREILVGALDGNIYETSLELSTEFYRRDEKYVKNVYKTEAPVCGIWTDQVPGRLDLRRVILATPGRLLHFIGNIGRHSAEGHGSIFAKLFESETPSIYEPRPQGRLPNTSMFVVTPEAGEINESEAFRTDRIFAWSSSHTVTHGKLSLSPRTPDLGDEVFRNTRKLVDSSILGPRRDGQSTPAQRFVALTQWHILQVFDERLVATNRLDDSIVYDQIALPSDERPISLVADIKKNTFWLFTVRGIYEIVVRDEDRDIWRVLMRAQKFEDALQYANNSSQKDLVATASGDYLIGKEKYFEAASVYGKSSKPFEEVSLVFIEKQQKDALRQYLLTKLSTLPKSAIMQRTILTSWLTEVFMAKLNSLEDMAMTKAELVEKSTPADISSQLHMVRREFHDFIRRYKEALDHKTVYDIISSHGREEELLFFSSTINDYNYVLSYWVQRENWPEALKALNKQTDSSIIYKYSSVLMTHAATGFIDIITRQPPGLDPRKLIPACLNYNNAHVSTTPLAQNQAIRYLNFEINQHNSTDAAVHNTLLSIYASHPSADETALLAYLESHTPPSHALTSSSKIEATLPYDADFALRLCIQHVRVRACVHIYSAMGQYAAAVTLALQHGQTDIAVSVAERPEHDQATRKKLWLAIARSVIRGKTTDGIVPSSNSNDDKQPTPQQSQPKGLAPKPRSQPPTSDSTSISTALSLLHRAPPDTLHIADLLPLLPNFIHLDSFRPQILSALQSYASEIASLRSEMDSSSATATRIKSEMEGLDRRWVLLEPGEGCVVCGEVLVERRFWVWGCGHGGHGDCVARTVIKGAKKGVGRRVRELRSALEGASGSSAGPSGTSGGGGGGGSGANGSATTTTTTATAAAAGDKGRRERLTKELDEILGRECVVCGEMAVRRVDEPFVSESDAAEAKAWAL